MALKIYTPTAWNLSPYGSMHQFDCGSFFSREVDSYILQLTGTPRVLSDDIKNMLWHNHVVQHYTRGASYGGVCDIVKQYLEETESPPPSEPGDSDVET